MPIHLIKAVPDAHIADPVLYFSNTRQDIPLRHFEVHIQEPGNFTLGSQQSILHRSAPAGIFFMKDSLDIMSSLILVHQLMDQADS